MSKRLVLSLLVGPLLAVAAAAQTVAPNETDGMVVGRGWVALGQGKAEEASGYAKFVLNRSPRDVAAAGLLVEAEIARAGASAGLQAYEWWIGQRRTEDPYVLRRVALAILREYARPNGDAGLRIEAFRALAADGDPETLAMLSAGASSGNLNQLTLLAGAGDRRAREQAVAEIVKKMKETPLRDKSVLIGALAASRSSAAVQPLVDLLKDPEAKNRAEAALALADLGASQAIDSIKALFEDQPYVKLRAAGALLKLGDSSGLQYIHEVEAEEFPMVKLGAYMMEAPVADARWVSDVRALTAASDPQARWIAADLLSPHDPDTARAVLEALMTDPNVTLGDRQSATLSYLKATSNDFGFLRRHLANPDSILRLKAAGRILELTR